MRLRVSDSPKSPWKRRRQFLTLFVAAALCAAGVARADFLVRGEDLDFVKAHLAEEPWKSGWECLKNDWTAKTDYRPRGPRETIARHPGRGDFNRQWRIDMKAAWNQARMWRFTGDERHAEIAREILVGWATVQKRFDGWEACLDLGECLWYGVAAADILRGRWDGWSADDTAAFQRLLKDVYLPCCCVDRGVVGPANKGALAMAAAMPIAIFCDDRELLARLVRLYLSDGVAMLPSVLPSGQMPEAGRDQGHHHGGLLALAVCAEMLWRQGYDVYSAFGDRLLAAGEYFSKQSLGEEVPFVTYGTTDFLYTKPCAGGWPHGRRVAAMLITAYRFRLGRETPWLERKFAATAMDADAFCFYLPEDKSTARRLKWNPPALAKVSADTLKVVEIGQGEAASCRLNDTKAAGSRFSLSVSGGDLWRHGAGDCVFAYREVRGKRWAFRARVDSLKAGHPFAKVAVMFRDSLEPGARLKAWAGLKLPRTAEWFMSGWDDMRGGSNWEKGGREFPDDLPVWLRVTREGEMVYCQWSPDGKSWTSLGVGCYRNLPDKLYVGIAAASYDPAQPATATLSHLAAATDTTTKRNKMK